MPVRPHDYRRGYLAAALFFPQTVELRLRKISRGLPQDIVAASTFSNLPLQRLQPLAVRQS
ncbi:hypothetical protein EVK84_16600 [Edwardsiella piscicida]|nr:hypothetical protein EVK84_16600 [Edwardsiella piscicida]